MNSVKSNDPILHKIVMNEKHRQSNGIELIASENFTSDGVMALLGSCLTNKYAEGLPKRRYYGGNEFIDQIESLCQKRALETFNLSDQNWSVNVQPYSGSVANMAVYLGLLNPKDIIMGLDLPSGGHLSHGFQTVKRKVSAAATYYTSIPYKVDKEGWINYDDLEELALEHRPKLIICGASAYPRDFDYRRLRYIANQVDAYLMCDMAHISGLIATGCMKSPFEYCDIVTTTTHKTLRGPRAAMIFCRKEYEVRINNGVFPGLQGGPHENKIAAIAYQLKEVQTKEFKMYCQQIIKNTKVLAQTLIDRKYKLTTNGTDNHLILVDLTELKITGSKIEKLCEMFDIYINKNTVPTDKSAFSPHGIRIGTPAMTTMGYDEKDFIKIGEYLDQIVQLALKIQERSGRKIVDFNKYLRNMDGEIKDKFDKLKQDINKFIQTCQ